MNGRTTAAVRARWVFLAAVLGGLAGGGGGAARAAAFVQGPYVQDPGADRMTVVWVVEPPSPGVVRFGVEGGGLLFEKESGEAKARHEVVIDGLGAGKVYTYRVEVAGGGEGGGDLESEEATFRTLPAVGSGSAFRWMLFGDTRSFHDFHAEVVAAMAGEPGVLFGVQTGDMVSDGEDPAQWDQYFAIERPFMRSVPVYPVIGNHDEFEGVAAELTARFVAPGNSPAPEHYYSFRVGNSWFTVLDGHVNILGFEGCLLERDLFMLDCFTAEQVAWVEADLLEAATAPGVIHRFVLVHIGPYSSKENRSGSMEVRRLLPLFRAMGVTAVLSGHDHYYERGLSAFGMPYVISGGAGASLYEVDEPSAAPHEVAYAESTRHYVLVDVDGDTVTFTAKKPDGTVIDTFEVVSAPECATDADCAAVAPPPDCVGPGTCSVAKHCAFECVREGENSFDLGDPEAEEPEPGGAPERRDAEPEPAASPRGDPPPGLGRGEPEAPPSETKDETGGGDGGCSGAAGGAGGLLAGLVGVWVALRKRRR